MYLILIISHFLMNIIIKRLYINIYIQTFINQSVVNRKFSLNIFLSYSLIADNVIKSNLNSDPAVNNDLALRGDVVYRVNSKLSNTSKYRTKYNTSNTKQFVHKINLYFI